MHHWDCTNRIRRQVGRSILFAGQRRIPMKINKAYVYLDMYMYVSSGHVTSLATRVFSLIKSGHIFHIREYSLDLKLILDL